MPYKRIEILYSLFSQTVHKTVKRRWRENRTGIRKEFDIKIYCTCRMPDNFTDNIIMCSIGVGNGTTPICVTITREDMHTRWYCRGVDNFLELGGLTYKLLIIHIKICAFSVQTQSWPWQLVQYCIGSLFDKLFITYFVYNFC